MKRLLLVLLLCVVSPVSAGDYLGTYANMCAQVRVNLGMDSASGGPVSNDEFGIFTRQGLMEVASIARAIRGIRIDTTVRGQYAYALDTSVMGVTGSEWVSGDTVKPFILVDDESFQAHALDKSLVDKQGVARRPWWYRVTDDSLYLYPVPCVSGDTIKMYTWEKPINIDTLSTFAQIDIKYRQGVFHYVLWRVALAKTHPAATIFQNEYAAYIKSLVGQKRTRGEDVPAGN